MKKFLFLLALVLHGTCSAQWTQILPTTVGTFTYYDMSVIAGANGNDTIFVCGTAGAGKPRIYRSFDGGTTWTSLPFFNFNPHNLSELQSVVAFRSGVVLCSGSNISGSWVYRSTDWGQTWNSSQTKADTYMGLKWGPNDAYVHAGTLFSQWGFSKDEGLTYTFFNNTLGQYAGQAPYVTDSLFYVKKSDGCIYKSVNQGQTWQGSTCNGTGGALLTNGHFFNADTGIWCGQYKLIKTYNGGISWDSIPLPHYNTEQATAFITHFFNRNLGVIWGNYITFTNDGGNTWQIDTSSKFNSTGTLYIGPGETLYRTQHSCYALGSQALVKRSLLTNLESKINIQVQVFPNPTGNELNFTNFSGSETVEIFNLMGIKVKEFQISNKINLQIPDGQYLVVIKDKKSVQTLTKNIVVKNP